MNEQRPSDAAVRRFVAAAIQAAGSQWNVSALLAEAGILEDGEPYTQTAISGWKTGHTAKVPAEPLFELARRLNLSLDEFVQEDHLPTVAALQAQVAVLWEAEQERRRAEGRPPLPEPPEAEQ